jgi:hypothetical protein
MLAVITHADSVAGWLIDPTSTLIAVTSRHGLALVERCVLLEVPVDELDQPPAPLPPGAVARRAHSDLLLFTPVAQDQPRERR